MIHLLIVILWLIFIVVTISSLSCRQFRDNRILGVTLSKKHAQHPEVKKTVASFTKFCFIALLLSVGCSLLLLIPNIRPYAESFMYLLVVFSLFINWLIVRSFQKQLISTKEENEWIYQQKNTVSVDLTVSREKGKSRVSSVWIWLFLLLSFVPTAVWFFNADTRQFYPLALSLIGPLCQLCTISLYYWMGNRQAASKNDQAKMKLAYVRQEDKINSIVATFSSLTTLIFWILFSLSIFFTHSSFLVIILLVFLVVTMLSIAYWQQRRTRELDEKYKGTFPQTNDVQEHQSTSKWGCYYNPSDPRILVPKSIASMGWTLNVGRPFGKAIYLGSTILVFALILFLSYGGIKNYQISLHDSDLVIDASMYDMTFQKDEVISVSLIKELPNGIRTNGYSGVSKNFGYFIINEYGNSLLYIYNNVNQYIVVELNGSDPGYVFINDKSVEKTEILYQNINHWFIE